MSEFFQDNSDYYVDHKPLLDALSDRILDIASQDPKAVIACDFVTNTSETVLHSDGISADHAVSAIARLVAQASTTETPIGAIFAYAHDPALHIDYEVSVLNNTREEPFALRSLVTQQLGDGITRMTTLTHINGKARHIEQRTIAPSDLTQDLVRAYIFDPRLKAALIDLLIYHCADDNIEDCISTLPRSDPHTPSTITEIEIIQAVRDEIQRERDAQKFAGEYGMDKPGYDELRRLLQYLY